MTAKDTAAQAPTHEEVHRTNNPDGTSAPGFTKAKEDANLHMSQPKKKLGGKRVGAGRPKGSKNFKIKSLESAKLLEELKFDPLVEMVDRYNRNQKVLHDMEVNLKHTTGAYASLCATQATLLNQLAVFGYRKIPERRENINEDRAPIAVRLNLNGDDK